MKNVLLIGQGDISKAIELELQHTFPNYDLYLAHHSDFPAYFFNTAAAFFGKSSDIQYYDIVINCCGIFDFSPISDDLMLGLDKWNYIFDANVKTAWQIALSYYRTHKHITTWKYLVNVGSESAHIAHSNSALYCSSKAALGMMTKCLSKDMLPDKFSVFQVNPGMLKDTKMTKYILEKYPQTTIPFCTPEYVAKILCPYFREDPEALSGKEMNIGWSRDKDF